MSYALYDYTETLNVCGVDPHNVKRVIASWGEQGDYAEWSGGFLLEMKDGRFAYASGWCDTTGWGCQDGANVTYFESEPERESLEDRVKDWDEEPSDLNRWHAHGCVDSYNS
jgi:hypothetical protein